MNIKKLNHNEEYQVALMSYLGYPQRPLAKKFKISKETLYNISKRHQDEVAKNLKDKVTPTRSSFERGIEYLVSETKQGKFDVQNNDLVSQLLEEPLNKIKFSEYSETISGYDGLMKRVFGENVIHRSVYDLFEDYIKSKDITKKLSKTKLTEEFISDVKGRLRKGYFDIENSDLKKKVVEGVLDTLTEREKNILKLYFGLDNKPMKLDEIGEIYNFTRERIRQIKEKSIRRLWHDHNSKPLKKLYGYSDHEIQDRFTKIEIDRKVEEKLREERELERINSNQKKEIDLNKNIYDFEFSVRTNNTLRAADIKTINELLNYSESDLLKFRNFGRKSFVEIVEFLDEYGLELKQD